MNFSPKQSPVRVGGFSKESDFKKAGNFKIEFYILPNVGAEKYNLVAMYWKIR